MVDSHVPLKVINSEDWRGGLVATSICCSQRGLEFSSQHLQDSPTTIYNFRGSNAHHLSPHSQWAFMWWCLDI